MRIEQVLLEYGQAVRPMRSAPRDGTSILAFSRDRGTIICYWEERPSRLAGPAWVEDHGAEIGYLDRYFEGWLDARTFRSFDQVGLKRLLIAYIDEARAAGDPMTFLEDPPRLLANDR
jgi:hypothetical protein